MKTIMTTTRTMRRPAAEPTPLARRTAQTAAARAHEQRLEDAEGVAAPEAFAVLTNAHLASFGKDDTICVRRPYISPSTHSSTHAVAFPVSTRRYASAPTPTPTPAPTYTSALTPPTPPGMPPMMKFVSSPPVPVSVSVRTSPASGGDARPKVGGVIGDADDTVSDSCPVTATRFHGWGRAGRRRRRRRRGDEELPTPVPWRSPLGPPAPSINVHVGAPPVYYESEGEGEEPQTPVPGLYAYKREATPTPYTRRKRERERERECEGERGREREQAEFVILRESYLDHDHTTVEQFNFDSHVQVFTKAAFMTQANDNGAITLRFN
ncbi:hypothetical protein B0H14DRAFT_3156744 [Mycena olivaceomarginata]|nr:hypothetical protein B0H14DRAFT_3156744 [Mycena olivaceomarginata]